MITIHAGNFNSSWIEQYQSMSILFMIPKPIAKLINVANWNKLFQQESYTYIDDMYNLWIIDAMIIVYKIGTSNAFKLQSTKPR